MSVLTGPREEWRRILHEGTPQWVRPEGERLWAYWQKQLEGELPVLDLPTDRPRPPVQSYRGASFKFNLSDQLDRGLKSLSAVECKGGGVALLVETFLELHGELPVICDDEDTHSFLLVSAPFLRNS